MHQCSKCGGTNINQNEHKYTCLSCGQEWIENDLDSAAKAAKIILGGISIGTLVGSAISPPVGVLAGLFTTGYALSNFRNNKDKNDENKTEIDILLYRVMNLKKIAYLYILKLNSYFKNMLIVCIN